MCVITATMAGTATAAMIANASLAAAAIGAGVSAYSAYSQGQQREDMYEYEAAVAEQNAKLAELQAQDALYRGSKDKGDLQQKLNQTRGTGRAMWGASGVLLDEGSPLDWQADLAERKQYDEMTIDYNMRKEAWGYRVNKASSLSEASAARAAASNSVTQGNLAAGASLLAGAGTVATRYYKFTE